MGRIKFKDINAIFIVQFKKIAAFYQYFFDRLLLKKTAIYFRKRNNLIRNPFATFAIHCK